MRVVSHQGGLYRPYFSSGDSSFTLVFYEAALSSYGLYEAGFSSGGLYEGGLSLWLSL